MERLQQQRNLWVSIILALIFFTFTAGFVIFFQRDLMALLQETWSHGQTVNNPYVTAIIIALLLFLLHRIVKRVTGLFGRWEAFTWLPSYLVLGLSSAVDSRTLRYNFVLWAAVLIGGLIVLLLACWARSGWPSDKRTPLGSLLLPSLVETVISMILCMTFTNHNAALHQELAAYRFAAKDDAARVANVGRLSLETTPALTALRNVAIARENRTGDELFFYPQPYGSDGLGVNRLTRQNTRFGADVFYTFLGAEPYGGETTAAFVQRIYKQDDTPYFRNLFASSLLLDGRLADFASSFPPTMISKPTEAPRHFREAWLLYHQLSPQATSIPAEYSDPELQPQLDDFMTTLQNSHTDHQTTLNSLFLTYGNTFWYYYAKNFNL